MVEGLLASNGGKESLLYEVLVLVEETMELGAVMWVTHILLRHLLREAQGLDDVRRRTR